MKTAPDPIYVQEFLFKEANTSQIFDGFTSIPAACNLVTFDKKRGLLYIGHNDKITVLKPAEENNPEWKIELYLPSVVSKIAINCDYSYIAVAVAQKPTILIYDVYSLARNSLNLLLEITSSNKPDSYVTDIRWNPSISLMLCTVTNDYTNGSFQLNVEDDIRENSTPKVSVHSKVSNDLQVLCAAWSPKGKQIVVGCKNGNIVQLKPDLKVARTITGPSPPIGEVISILWISNYQFCAAFLNNEQHINVLIIDAPKGETHAIFTCYEDITYGFPDPEGEDSVPRYYFEHVPEWGLIIAGSSSSSEIAVLGSTDGGANWNQWQLVDSGRAQLPLMRTTEIYPVGLAVDRSPTNKLPWGTDSTLPYPIPILHILGTTGRLCSFHIVNLAPNCPVINSAPTEIITAPIPSQAHTLPTETSFNMSLAATSTPRLKQVETMPERSKPPPITNIFGDSLRAAGFFQKPEQPVEQPKPQEQKSITSTVVVTKPMTPKETSPLKQAKAESKSVVNKEVNSQQTVEQKASIDDSIRMRAYLQEQALFEKELRNRLEPQVWECGTDEEKKRLGETSATIEQFLRDLKDATNSLSSDITYLKALLLQSFAWVEETKSKNAASTDITSRNCGENSKIAELQRLYYYTQTQLNQVSKILDLEWSDHKAQEKAKMKIPSLEFIYQNLLLHNKIIAKEKEKLEQISRRWKFLNRSLVHTTSNISNLNRTMSNLHISSPKSTAVIRGNTDVIDARCKAIASRTLNFTYEKQIKLKALLTESSPRIIKSVNPSPIQDRLKATLSSLASLSPVITEAKTKTEPSILKPSTVNKQSIEKPKSQSPLASLNSIVARIGSSDTNNISIQNKIQQKLPATNVSFPAANSSKQTEKKPVVPTVSLLSQPKQKQDLNAGFPSITFGTSVLKPQEVLFPKSSLVDISAKSNKESINDNNSRAPESTLFSTGLLKDALSTENASMKTEGIARGLPSLSATPAVKTDATTTFSFATSNIIPSITKSSSSATALDTMMSFTYPKSMHTPAEPSTVTTQAQLETPIELMALSLGTSANPLIHQSADRSNNSTDERINTVTSSTNFSTSPVTTEVSAIPSAIADIGGITINFVSTDAARKSMETPSSTTSVSDVKAPLGTLNAQPPTSIPAASIFNQSVIKNTATISQVSATLPAATFVTAAFPSITSTFGTPASTPAVSVFSGYSNISTPVTSASNTTSPFQSSLSKPTFGETATSIPVTSFGISNTSTGVISFGISTTAVSITPAFGKSPISSPSDTQFPSVQTPASTAGVFEKPVINPASTPFGTSSSVFSNVPATSSSSSIFGGNNSIFGTTPLSSSGNIFGGNSTIFGTASSESIFGAQKAGTLFGGATNTASTSPFGNTASNTQQAVGASTGTNVFQSTVASTSPIGIGGQQSVLGSQPAFGQASAFGAKPVFGSSPIFGSSKPVFGSGFGSSPAFESPSLGFGSPPAMQGNSTMENAMPKVFGEVTGSTTFESLASQSGGLSFGSLAQKNQEPEKPTFTASSSFSSWR